VPLAPIFFPGLSDYALQTHAQEEPSSLIHQCFAIATLCPRVRHIPQDRLSIRIRKNQLFPNQENIDGLNWRCHIALSATISTGSLSSERKQSLQTQDARIFVSCQLLLSSYIGAYHPFETQGSEVLLSPKTHLLLPKTVPSFWISLPVTKFL
jgi:hypothetical protein